MTKSDEAAEAARRLATYQELRAFTAWLLWESRSLATRLSREARAAAIADLAPLEAELLRFEDGCRLWERRRRGTAPLPAPVPVEVNPREPSPWARTQAAMAWSRESRLIAAQAQIHSRAARERATAMKAKAREVADLVIRTRSERSDGAAVPRGPVRLA